MIRAYVVDDERLAVQRLTRLLEETRRVTIAGSTTDSMEALAFLRANEVDVVFLDVQMPGLTGFELLEQLDRDVPVVFTTAHDQYALDAFSVNSLDYLLKPIEPDRLDRALDKLERFAGQPRPDVRYLARALARELAPGRKLERIASRVGERTTVLDAARITHFFAKDKLTFAAASGREHVIDHTIAELETQLDSRRFAHPPRHHRQRRLLAGALPRCRRPSGSAQGRWQDRAGGRPRPRTRAERAAGHLALATGRSRGRRC